MAKIPQFTEQVDTQLGGGLLPQGLVRVQEGGADTGFGQSLAALGMLVSKAQTAWVDKKILDKRTEAKAFFEQAKLEAEKDLSGSALFNFGNSAEAFQEKYLEGLSGRAREDAERSFDLLRDDALGKITRVEATRRATAYKASLGSSENELIKRGNAFIAGSSSEAEITTFKGRFEEQIDEHREAYFAGASNGSFESLAAASLAFDKSNQAIRTSLYTQLLAQGTPASIGIVDRALNDSKIRGSLGTSLSGLQVSLNQAKGTLATINLGALHRQANILSTSGGDVVVDPNFITGSIAEMGVRANELADLTFKGGLTPEQLFKEANTLVESFFETNGRTIVESGTLQSVLEGFKSHNAFAGLDIEYEDIATKALQKVSGQNKVAIANIGEAINDRVSLQTQSVIIPSPSGLPTVVNMNLPTVTAQELSDAILGALAIGNTGEVVSGLFVPDSPESIVMDVLQPTVDPVQANLSDPRNREIALTILDTTSTVLGVPIENKKLSKLKEDLTKANKTGTILQQSAEVIIADMLNGIPPVGILTPEQNQAISTSLSNNLDIHTATQFARNGVVLNYMQGLVKDNIAKGEYATVIEMFNAISDNGGSVMAVMEIAGIAKKDYPETEAEIIGSLALMADDSTLEAVSGFFADDPQAMSSMVTRNGEVQKILLNAFAESDGTLLFSSSENVRKIVGDALTNGNGTTDPFHPDIIKKYAPMLAFFVTKEMRTNQRISQTGITNDDDMAEVYTNAATEFKTFVDATQVSTSFGLIPKNVLNLLQPNQTQAIVDDLDNETIRQITGVTPVPGGHPFTAGVRTIEEGVIEKIIKDAERVLSNSGITARPHLAFAVDATHGEGDGEIFVIPMRDEANQTQGYITFGFRDGKPEPLLNGASLPGLISVAAVNTLGSRSIKTADVVNDEFVRFMELERQFGDISRQRSRNDLPFYVSSIRVPMIEQMFIDAGGDINDIDALLEFTEQHLGSK